MHASVLRLHELQADHAPLVGGKAKNLGVLLGLGFPVPPGFVVSAAAYERFADAAGLSDDLRRLRTDDERETLACCERIRARIDTAELTPELTRAILSAHAELLEGRAASLLCAVRSSATAEDLGELSFAGQHGTYYYVDASQLVHKVKQCWASLWSAEAVSYRATHGIDHAGVSMAVLVQEMVPADVSGVTFTANPVSGARDELIIESCWGMGAALVDGRVTPDRYTVARDGLTLREQRIAQKRFMVRPRLDPGREARIDDVPHDQQRRETLSPALVRTIAEASLGCEAHFGRPQDVEWAILDGRLHVLQSRPITVMGRNEIGRGVSGPHVLFKPIVENFTDPLTPLSADLFGFLLPPGLRNVQGWLYVDLAACRLLLPFDISDEALADRVYNFARDAPPWELVPARLPATLMVVGFSWLCLAVLLARTRRLPDDALDRFRSLCLQVEADASLGPRETLRRLTLLPRLLAPIGDMAIFVNCSCVRFVFWIRLLRDMLRRWAPDLGPDADVLLSSGSEGVLSAEMGRGIWALAEEARRSPRVQEILVGTPPSRALAALSTEPEAREFVRRLDAFLAVNGHRAVKEFELRSPRWDEDPATVLGMVRNYLTINSDPETQERNTAERRAELWSAVGRRLEQWPLERALGLRLRLVSYVAERVRYFLKLRENSRFFHIMAFSTTRKKILRIEAELLRRGRLKCPDDAFFLLLSELAALESGQLDWRDVEDRIRERRVEHVRLTKLGPPRTLGIPRAPTPPSAVEVDGTLLAGQSASPGRYEGRARVILDPSVDVELLPGEVLVAPYTDPAWTPLFLTAGAAVVEIGSFLSHAGTVAREFGMPCVVDVAEATRRIRTGDRVAVDGDRGRVHILATAEPGA